MNAHTWFGFAMVAIQLALVWPLMSRLRRSRSREGISLSSEAMWVVAGAGWALYGYLDESLPLLASGILAAAASFVVLSLAGAFARDTRTRVVAVGAGTLGLLAIGYAGWGEVGLGGGLAALGLVQFLPQMVVSVRSLASRRPTPGVSPVAAALRASYAFGWAVYAGAWWWADVNWPLAIWGVTGGVAYALQAIAARRSSS